MLNLTTTPTSPIFYENIYARTWPVWVDAALTDEKNRQALIFDATIFYPRGGGQRGDRGALIIPADLAKRVGLPDHLFIADTHKKESVVHHLLKDKIDPDLISAIVGTQQFTVELDWDFRFTQMRLHSAAHLLHCCMEKVLGVSLDHPSLSDLHEERGINRYDRPNLISPEDLSTALQLLNDFTAHDHAIKIYPDTRGGKPDWARLWQCENWLIPCGGVHPATTKEIGLIGADVTVKRQQTTVSFWLMP